MMKKKFISILLCGAMIAMTLMGCQSNEAATEGSASQTGTEAKETIGSETMESETVESDTSDDMTAMIKTDGEKYKIALSNSYMGNDWRQQMERIVEYVAKQEPYASRCELTIVNCENDPESQSASIDALSQQGYDAILVDPASETGVNEAIQRAIDVGIKVIVFDQPASAEGAYSVLIDAVEAYHVMAKWMAEAMGGEGNAVMDQGLPGAAVSEQEYNAAKEIFDGYEGISIVSDYISNYAEADGESSLASVIAANSDIDAVVTQGYTTSVARAFKKAGIDEIPVSCGGGYNGNLLTFLENDSQGIIHVYIPGISAVALNYAIRILDGEEINKNISISPAYVATSNDYDMGEYSDINIDVAEEGVNCFKDQSSDLLWPCITSNFGLDIPMEVVLGE